MTLHEIKKHVNELSVSDKRKLVLYLNHIENDDLEREEVFFYEEFKFVFQKLTGEILPDWRILKKRSKNTLDSILKGFDSIETFREENGLSFLSKMDRLKFYRICFRCCAEYIESVIHVPLSARVLANTLQRIGTVFDYSFPGYAKSKAIYLLINNSSHA